MAATQGATKPRATPVAGVARSYMLGVVNATTSRCNTSTVPRRAATQ